MKRNIVTLFLILAAAFGAWAGGKGAILTFDSTEKDFGTIPAKGGAVTMTYDFTNTGTEPLVIVSVSNGGCGCTTPQYPKQPIAPGKTGKIVIKFNPANRSGYTKRTVKVKSNAANGKVMKLSFDGTIY
ncbi:MAG: DUF1573 domain-containing protein [Firmicutes bacterium]|nr:DUF1573 domain-containing protein [Bacillota bacterium]MCM1400982.1 DUF1573 domain-containing protein [Bacteroides sp.]MCM1476505.1 DUF1573 domain-containing protein [Bacteroides sp.]